VALAATVAKTLAGLAGTFGVAVRNLKTGLTFTLASDDFFPSASLYKVAVMYEVFRQAGAGSLSLDETITVQDQDLSEGTDDEPMSLGDQVTIRQALSLMIDVSSNAAGHILADRVGWEQINQSMADLGLNHTRLPVGDWKAQMTDWRNDTACTSPSDLLAFFDRLYHHQLVGPDASDQMLKLLLSQHINDRIPANLPPGTAVAHKTGNLEGVVNDGGIIYGPGADFVVVILSQGADDGNATNAEAVLARAIYDLFDPKV
jgi:beta-lactamase class A